MNMLYIEIKLLLTITIILEGKFNFKNLIEDIEN